MPATAENRICIAVVPIEDFPSQSEDYFAAGLTEDPVSAAFPIDSSRLRVVTIPKSEAGDRVEQIDRLRKQLSLDYLLRGSVRRFDRGNSYHLSMARPSRQEHPLVGDLRSKARRPAGGPYYSSQAFFSVPRLIADPILYVYIRSQARLANRLPTCRCLLVR